MFFFCFVVQVNEYSALKDSALYSWAELSPGSFFLRLGGLCLVTFTVLAAPIAAASFNPGKVRRKSDPQPSLHTYVHVILAWPFLPSSLKFCPKLPRIHSSSC